MDGETKKKRRLTLFNLMRGTVGPALYALTVKTITQNRFYCSVISRNCPSTGSILIPVVMIALGVRCLRFRLNRAVILATMMFTLFSQIIADLTYHNFCVARLLKRFKCSLFLLLKVVFIVIIYNHTCLMIAEVVCGVTQRFSIFFKEVYLL